MHDLPDELLSLLFNAVPALELRCAMCVCSRWRVLIGVMDRTLMLVTEGATNELVLLDGRGEVVQRVKALPPPRRRHGVGGGNGAHRGGSKWPTCMTLGPQGDLIVSQYKINGLLLFRRCPAGFQYQRTIVSHPSLASPEGVIFAHNSYYLVSVDSGKVTRLSLDGKVMEEAEPFEMEGDFYAMWGMCLHGDTLFIAAHVSDEAGEYDLPTATNTGAVLMLALDGGTGTFVGEICWFAGLDSNGRPYLNRPSDPSMCKHGFLHVSSFISSAEGHRRRIFKLATHGHQSPQGKQLGWLATSEDHSHMLRSPWGLSFGPTGSVYVTSHAADGASPCGVVKLESCCGRAASRGDEVGAIHCGPATMLTPESVMKEPNYVFQL